jgi:hypothetical protein
MKVEEIKEVAQVDNPLLPAKLIEVEIDKLQLVININNQLREDNAALKRDLATVITTGVIMSDQFDFKNPFKLAAQLASMIKNPEKFSELFKPFVQLMERNKDLHKDIKSEYERRKAEMAQQKKK